MLFVRLQITRPKLASAPSDPLWMRQSQWAYKIMVRDDKPAKKREHTFESDRCKRIRLGFPIQEELH